MGFRVRVMGFRVLKVGLGLGLSHNHNHNHRAQYCPPAALWVS